MHTSEGGGGVGLGGGGERSAGRYELGRHSVVWARGDIDLTSAGDLRRVLVEASGGGGPPRVIVDLTDVGFMDSTGLHLLLEARRAAEARGGTVRLVGANRSVRRLLDTTGLAVMFPLHATVADAARADPETGPETGDPC